MYGEDKVVDEYVLGQMNTLKARIDSEDIFGNWFRLSSDYLSQQVGYKDRAKFLDRKSTRLNSSHSAKSRMPSSA